jgi:serine/threonine-protein kinase PknG
MNCGKAGCGAVIGVDGYCTRCGTAAKPPTPSRPAAAPHATTQAATTLSPSSRLPAHQRAAHPVTSEPVPKGPRPSPLIRLPEVPGDEHLAPVLDDPQVPENKRLCPNPPCRHKVGRPRDGRHGRVEGFCPQCRTRYSFRPPLQPGLLVGDGQFRVEGAIAHGGLGWIYRAWDCWVSRWVVLKGLIDPDDPDKRQTAIDELAALADANHPNIVTVHTVVRHPHPLSGHTIDYIVMECLSGKSLKQLHQERPDDEPGLPVDQVCGFGLAVLAALRHLHEKRGLLYCDLSGDNVIHSPHGVKLIDLGAVRRIDDADSPVWGKPGFQDPQIAIHGPSVATDLYTVARMMAVLSFPFSGFSTDRQGTLPGPEEVELLASYPSFYGLLSRATNLDPQRRFASAAEMAEQLEGVLREIRAKQEDRPFPAASTRFGPELRVVGTDPDTFLTGKLDTTESALALPDPQVDPADQHAGLLAAISGNGPDETERVLAALTDPSLETRLRLVRARIELRHSHTGNDLDWLAGHHPDDWRVDWYRGLKSLVEDDVKAGRRAFSDVLDALPGEAAPKLALALCAAREGDSAQAEGGYSTVWQTDQSYVSAAFGLARARLTLGELDRTAAALDTVPEGSRYAPAARLCAILARARSVSAGRPPNADFFKAAENLLTSDLDERRCWHAIAKVFEAVLSWELAGRPWPNGSLIPGALLGHQLTEHGVRNGLEAAYRKLAQLAVTRTDRISFVDKANHCRNPSWI